MQVVSHRRVLEDKDGNSQTRFIGIITFNLSLTLPTPWNGNAGPSEWSWNNYC